MKKLKILIVDDEAPARRKLRKFVKNEPQTGEIFEATDGLSALEQIETHSPELLFLDIQMPGMTGFELIEEIGVAQMPPVIFVTAYDQYAIAAFEVQALDYLLKPFDLDRFQKAFRRVIQQLDQQPDLRQLLREIRNKPEFLQRILVNKGERYFFVDANKILYVSAEDKYANLQTADGQFLLRETLTRLAGQLDPDKFARVHRSHIVNLAQIKEIQPWANGDFRIILNNGSELPLSRRYRENVFRK
ncbi:MAG: response regulator transcription factor [Calditrichaeota bacterium]|nr:response regulator transcription factor [Calditrichota bacterium]